MEQASFKSMQYVPSDSIEMQGKYSKIKKYEDQGYNIKESRNGYWLLTRPSKLSVTIENSKNTGTFNMRNDVLMHYGRKKMTENLQKTFLEDIGKGKIKFQMNEDGTQYSLN